jgi:hypothetical protein
LIAGRPATDSEHARCTADLIDLTYNRTIDRCKVFMRRPAGRGRRRTAVQERTAGR